MSASSIVVRYPVVCQSVLPHHGDLISELGYHDGYPWLDIDNEHTEVAALSLCAGLYALADHGLIRFELINPDPVVRFFGKQVRVSVARGDRYGQPSASDWGVVERSVIAALKEPDTSHLVAALPSMRPSEWGAGKYYSYWAIDEEPNYLRAVRQALDLAGSFADLYEQVLQEDETEPSLSRTMWSVEEEVINFVMFHIDT